MLLQHFVLDSLKEYYCGTAKSTAGIIRQIKTTPFDAADNKA
jgi:hypothetical protein